MIYLACYLSAFLMGRGLGQGDATTAGSGAVLLMLSAAAAVMEWMV